MNGRKLLTNSKKQNFPHCIGAINGKHITLQAPINSGSDFYNYKSQFSIVLMAVADADYNFIFVDIGCQGRISEGSVLKNYELYKKIDNRTLNSPEPSALVGRDTKVPYVFLGDAAFSLSEHIMKSYSGIHPSGSPKRLFNYRLSKIRRVIENVFGIISSVFTVLQIQCF